VTLSIGEPEARALVAVCRGQLRWEPGMPARVVTTERALGVFTVPPFEVLAFVAVPASGGAAGDDLVVPLAALCDAVESTPDRVDLDGLPRAIVRPGPSPSLSALPPEDGWQLPIHGLSGDLVPAVEAARAEFAERSMGLGSSGRQELADEIWSRPGFGGMPLRGLHAARALGMLGNDATRVAVATSGQWRRLSTARGQVFSYAMGPATRLALSVVR
jgi:hypothetical protein